MRGLFTLRAPRGGHVGYTVPCTIDNLVAFGRDLLPLLSEAAMLRVTCGKGESVLAAGDLPKPAFSPSEQQCHKPPSVNCEILKNDVGLRETGWLMVKFRGRREGREDLDRIMAASW